VTALRNVLKDRFDLSVLGAPALRLARIAIHPLLTAILLLAISFPMPASAQEEFEITVAAEPFDGGMAEGGGMFFRDDQASLWASPNAGYTFLHWTENGAVVSEQETYDFVVTGDRHLVAHFEADLFQLAYYAGEGGSISGPALQWVAYGADGEAVTAVPDEGYHFTEWSDWLGDGAIRQDLFVMENIAATAHFARNQYMLVYRSGSGGYIAGTTPQFVLHGADADPVTATPLDGYQFVEWSDGVTSAERHDAAVGGNLDVTAVFAIMQHTLTYRAGGGGSIAGSAVQSVEHGSDGEAVTAVPAAGHYFTEWNDGVTTPQRQELSVSADLDVTALFEPNLYELQYAAGEGGWLLGPLQQTVAHGQDGTVVIASPKTGYSFSHWSDGFATEARQELAVTGPLSLTAQFAGETALYEFPGGSGTEADPYRVATPADLDAVRLYPGAHFQQVADIDLGQPPWNEGEGWSPIGTGVAGGQFSGYYDGKRYAIQNLMVQRPESDFQGLFGDVANALIERVTLQNARIAGNRYVGALAGSERDSLLQNIHIDAEVQGLAFTGGLVGSARGGGIQDVQGEIAVTGSRQSGGLVGFAAGTDIRRVSAAGSVAGDLDTGGLLGELSSFAGDEDSYAPGSPAPTTTAQPESQSTAAPDGQAATVNLSDGSSSAIASQPASYEIELARADNDLEQVATVETMTALRTSGTLREITLAGSGDPSGLRPVLTLPAAEAGTIDLDTVLVLRLGPLFVGGELVEDCLTMLPTSVDSSGNLRFTDPLMPYAAAGDGRSTAAMIAPHAPDTFVGWDFSAVWAADAELVQNDGYPYLLGAQMPYHLIYQAGIGGQVVGETRQSLLPGVLGASVGLQAELGAFFAGWSDGGADATRSDGVVDSDRLLVARFRSAGGADLDWYAKYGFTPGDGQNWSDLDAFIVSGKNTSLLQEFIADTDPHDPESRLRVLGLELAAPLRVHFAPASAARLYNLQFKDDLAEGEWSDLPGVDPQSGSGDSDHLVDPDPAQFRCYRIRATIP
jgi:hypothetical protein